MPKFFPSLRRHDMQRSGKSSCILVAHESLKACASIRLLSRNDPAQTVADVSVPKSQRTAADATAYVRTNMFDDICTTNNQIVRGPACGVRPTPCLAKQVLFLDVPKLSLRYLGPSASPVQSQGLGSPPCTIQYTIRRHLWVDANRHDARAGQPWPDRLSRPCVCDATSVPAI